MINTSQTFYNNSVFKYRTTRSKATIEIFDLTAKGDVDNATVNLNKFFYGTQMYDDLFYDHQYATGELNEFKLDGSMTLLPNTITTEQLGWWTTLGDEDGLFVTNPALTVELDNLHQSAGITCYYDEFSYPIKSKCYWYNGGTLLDSMVIDNQDSHTQIFDNPVDNYDKIVIEIQKVKSYAYAKMSEVGFGIEKTFEGDDMMSGTINEEVSTLCNTINPKQLSLSIKNFDQRYNVFNPQDLMRYFKHGQRCSAYSGVLDRETNTYEYVPMGVFYIDKADMKDSQLTINAYGVLNQLNDIPYYSKSFTANTVEYIIGDILGNGYPYYINDNIKSKTLTGYIPMTTKKEALKYVLIAVGGIVKEGRDGMLYFYRPTEDLSCNQIVTEDTVYEMWGNSGTMLAGLDKLPKTVQPIPYIIKINRDNQLGNLNTSTIGYYNQINIVRKNYIVGSTSEELFNDSITTDSDGFAIIQYPYSSAVTVSGVPSYQIYADCVVISGTANTTYSVEVRGKKYTIEESIVSASLPSNTNVYDETKLSLNIDSYNTLFTNIDNTKEVGAWYLSLLQKRNDVSFKWWSVATVEAADTVDFVTHYDETKNMIVTSIKYNLSGLIADVKGVC